MALHILDKIQDVDNIIAHHLYSDVPLVQEIAKYIAHNKGKRLRSKLAIITGQATDKSILLAAAIELIHTASLLHDDIVDGSLLRRGLPTAHTKWGEQASILVGDFLYSRAFQILSKLKNHEINDIMASSTNSIAEGEVFQLVYSKDMSFNVDNYLMMIEKKTAVLFVAACTAGGCLSNPAYQKNYQCYGFNIGMAFQLMDDVLDYTGSQQDMGKSVGDDLSEGKMTLPLILFLQQLNTKEKQVFIQSKQDPKAQQDILHQVVASGATDKTLNLAANYQATALAAINDLPESIYKQDLHEIADMVVNRVS